MTFDREGNYLTVGDNDGRVVIFKFHESQVDEDDPYPYIDFYDEIIAFDPDYDCAKMIEIAPSITGLSWLPSRGNPRSHLLISNEKTIKLFSLSNTSSYDDQQN